MDESTPAAAAPKRLPVAPGISLLGIGVSLAVLAVLAALAIPHFFQRPEVTLENAAKLLAKDLLAAQNLAAYLRKPIVVAFTDHGYQPVGLDGSELGEEDRARLGRSYDRFGIFEGVTISDIDVGEDGYVVFLPNGQLDGPGRLTLAFGSARKTLQLHAAEGALELLDESSRR